MKKLLFISILASILVVIFNKCYCDETNPNNSNNTEINQVTQSDMKPLAGVSVRLRKRA